jgi:hypothetical protein
MTRINVVKGSDTPITLTFKSSDGSPIDLTDYNDPEDFFLITLFYKSGEVLARYDSRPQDYDYIPLPSDPGGWSIGSVFIFMETNVTASAKEGDIYYQLRRRQKDSVPVDTWIDAYSQEEYLFTIVRAI